jgi:hypothetical protein
LHVDIKGAHPVGQVGGEGLAKRKGYRMMGVRRKRGAKARVDGQKPDIRRERGRSGLLTAKSIFIKHAERRSGDCARKAAELTSGDLPGGQKSAEGIVVHVVGKASEALQGRKVE